MTEENELQKLKLVIHEAVRRWQRSGGYDQEPHLLRAVGIQVFSANDFIDFLNTEGFEEKVVVKTNKRYSIQQDDDEYKPSAIVFLVMDKNLAEKILVLGYLADPIQPSLSSP